MCGLQSVSIYLFGGKWNSFKRFLDVERRYERCLLLRILFRTDSTITRRFQTLLLLPTLEDENVADLINIFYDLRASTSVLHSKCLILDSAINHWIRGGIRGEGSFGHHEWHSLVKSMGVLDTCQVILELREIVLVHLEAMINGFLIGRIELIRVILVSMI